MRAFSSFVLLAVFGAACAPAMEVRVGTMVHGQPEVSLSDLRGFAMMQQPLADAAAFDLVETTRGAMVRKAGGLISSPSGRFAMLTVEESPTLTRTVAATTRNLLVERGLIHDEADPQCFVSVAFVDATFHPFARQGVHGGIGASSDHGVGVGVGVDFGHEPTDSGQRVHGRSVAVYIYDAANPDEPIWHGSAMTTSTSVAFEKILPLLLREVLSEFPHPSGKPARRSVSPVTE